MLGYTAPNNDVYVFFEDDDVERLGTGKVQGTFINFKNPKMQGKLEALIDEGIGERTKTAITRGDDGYITALSLALRNDIYLALKEHKAVDMHEGFRHICLRDANDLEHLSDSFNYQQCSHHRKPRITP